MSLILNWKNNGTCPCICMYIPFEVGKTLKHSYEKPVSLSQKIDFIEQEVVRGKKQVKQVQKS